jgi:hypothetical protein
MAHITLIAAQFPGASGVGSHPLIPSGSSGALNSESKNNSNGGSFMNKLLKPALIAFTAFLTTVLVSCSGSDGKGGDKGEPGSMTQACTAAQAADGSVQVVCDGTPVGHLLAPGTPGGPGLQGESVFCAASPNDAGTGWDIDCNGTKYVILNGAGGGAGSGCQLLESEDGLHNLTISCGGINFRLTLCGNTISGNNGQTFNENTHFCTRDYTEGDDDQILSLCGAGTVASPSETYDPDTEYCARDLIIALSRTLETGDLLANAVVSDIDVKNTRSENWKVLKKTQCFATGFPAATCSSFGATSTSAVYQTIDESGALAASVVLSVSSCGEDKFFDKAEGECLANADDCVAILEGENTCISKTIAVPASGRGSIYINSCEFKFEDQDATARKVWWDPANVSSCDERSVTPQIALKCARSTTTTTEYRQLSQTLAANAGEEYTDKISCYNIVDPSDCGVSGTVYISTSSAYGYGHCMLSSTSTGIACPTVSGSLKYALNDTTYYKNVCRVYVLNNPEIFNGTAPQKITDAINQSNTDNIAYLANLLASACVGYDNVEGQAFTCANFKTHNFNDDTKLGLAEPLDDEGEAVIERLADICEIVNDRYEEDKAAAPVCYLDLAQAGSSRSCKDGFAFDDEKNACYPTANKTLPNQLTIIDYPGVAYKKHPIVTGGDVNAAHKYIARVEAQMCPLKAFDEKTGLCDVSPAFKNPSCFAKYTAVQNDNLCSYAPTDSDCPLGYSWSGKICESNINKALTADPKCPHGIFVKSTTAPGDLSFGFGSDAAGLAKRDSHRERCVDKFETKNCPDKTRLSLTPDENGRYLCEYSGDAGNYPAPAPACIRAANNPLLLATTVKVFKNDDAADPDPGDVEVEEGEIIVSESGFAPYCVIDLTSGGNGDKLCQAQSANTVYESATKWCKGGSGYASKSCKLETENGAAPDDYFDFVDFWETGEAKIESEVCKIDFDDKLCAANAGLTSLIATRMITSCEDGEINHLGNNCTGAGALTSQEDADEATRSTTTCVIRDNQFYTGAGSLVAKCPQGVTPRSSDGKCEIL